MSGNNGFSEQWLLDQKLRGRQIIDPVIEGRLKNLNKAIELNDAKQLAARMEGKKEKQKKAHPEDDLTKQVANYIRSKYPEILFHHSPNGGFRNAAEAGKFKAMGTCPGIPDIMIFKMDYNGFAGVRRCGLAIELKIGKNTPSDNQVAVMAKLEANGWVTAVCWTYEEAQKQIDNYLN